MKPDMWEINYKYSRSIKNDEKLFDRYDPHELKVTEISNGVILPLRKDRSSTYGLGGVLDENGTFVPESSFFLPFNHTGKADWGGAYPFEKEQVSFYEETVIFAGLINNNEWGHFITDWSVRLWYTLDRDKECKVVFCQRGKGELIENIRRLFDAIGIHEDRFMILSEGEDPCGFSKIVIPEASLSPQGYTDEFRKLFEAVTDSVMQKAPDVPVYKKIYMTRTGFYPLKEYGEREIEQFFAANGFHVMMPERLSLEEQICCLAQCEEIASVESSAAHNIVFSKKGVHQIIMEKSQAVNERQLIICQCCDAKADFIGTYPKIKFYDYYSYGPFLVGFTKKLYGYLEESGRYTFIPKSNAMIWIRNYTLYVFSRLGGVFKRAFGRVKRRLQKAGI